MSTFIESDQSAPNLLHASPISRSGFVHPDQRVIKGLTCTMSDYLIWAYDAPLAELLFKQNIWKQFQMRGVIKIIFPYISMKIYAVITH